MGLIVLGGLFVIASTVSLYASNLADSINRSARLSVKVTDASNGNPLEYVGVLIDDTGNGQATDLNGMCHFIGLRIPRQYTVMVKMLGYKEQKREVYLYGDSILTVSIRPNTHQLRDVVVVGRSGRGITTSTTIDTTAMQHLQPTSIRDLLELLPGGMFSPPSRSEIDQIRLREAGNPSSRSQYDTGALGTAFVIDGVRINTDANMQRFGASIWSPTRLEGQGRRDNENAAKGVDMRSIGTDDIADVEIIRGIPSAVYGDITSGLVRVKRRNGGNALRTRFKADISSELYYVGVDKQRSNYTVNTSAEILSSHIDPRDAYDNFYRFGLSLRGSRTFLSGHNRILFAGSLDAGGTINNSKTDPERQTNKEDKYYVRNSRYAADLSARINRLLAPRFFEALEFRINVAVSPQLIDQTRVVNTARIASFTHRRTEGESDGIFLPQQYIGRARVEGLPVSIAAHVNFSSGNINGHKIRTGFEWSYSKNYGRGQLLDPYKPIELDMDMRPVPFREIPGDSRLAYYLEDEYRLRLGKIWSFEAQPGLRISMPLAVPREYDMHLSPNIDPRLNIRFGIDTRSDDGRPIRLALAAGIGRLSLLPSSAFLYPDPIYQDLVELNYYPMNPDHRRIHFRTFIFDGRNFSLHAAHNFKTELRLEADYHGYTGFVLVYREDMKDGFRPASRIKRVDYVRYDYSGIDDSQLTGPPNLALLPSNPDSLLVSYGITTNGSRTLKRGIEWQISSPRYKWLHSRLTWSGALEHTIYRNSEDEYSRPSGIYAGREYPFIGIYRQSNGYDYKRLATSLMVDSYSPRLGLMLSASFQCEIFTSRLILSGSTHPVAYVAPDGLTYPFGQSEAQDPVLSKLISSTEHRRADIVPFAGFFNFKATKRLWKDRLRLALFVNRIVAIEPEYRLGTGIRRRYTKPYFGMEMGIQI